MDKLQTQSILKEVISEQHPLEDEETLMGYIKDGEYDINESVGAKINYDIDLKAKSLLKNYVFYARYKRIAEFKQLYVGEYVYLQTKYYKPSNI